jgi:hypothetical protein
LKLTQDELGDDDGAVDEAGFADVGNAAVDDDAGVEDLEGIFRRLLAAEQAAERGEVQ